MNGGLFFLNGLERVRDFPVVQVGASFSWQLRKRPQSRFPTELSEHRNPAPLDS